MFKKVLTYIQKNDLNVWVFFTGGIILVIEVVAVRLLSPYFGNTLYSVSSVLSVVLLALSAGYWVGGVLADRSPKRSMFYSLILASGLLLLFIEMFRASILTKISSVFSVVSGPLIAALVLFIGPAFLLGMLSPLAIKLKSDEAKKLGIGRVTGGMFFWSTLGSISGSLLAGFVLIPHFGSSIIMLSIGIVLVCMGFIPLLLGRALSSKKIAVVLFVSIVSFWTATATYRSVSAGVVYQSDGLYERITIREGTYAGRPTRFLEQDRSHSGAAYIDSDELVYGYTQYYQLYKLFRNSLNTSLVLGGGAYSIPKALLNEPGQPLVDVAEIEPELYDLSKQYFGVVDNPRLINHVVDGRRFLRDSKQPYDLIFGDVYHSILSIPSHFTTVEFFELAKSKLSDDGVFISNIIGDTYRTKDSFTFSQMRTFQQVFPNSYFFAVDSPSRPSVQNIIMLGARNDSRSIDFNVSAGNGGIFSGLQNKLIDPARYNLEQHTLLTDDYVPVDYLTAKTLGRTENYGESYGQHSMAIIEQLLSYGPRYSGSQGNVKTQDMLLAEMRLLTEAVTAQSWEEDDVRYTNVIAKVKPELSKRIVLGTHFDSRRFADKDAVNPAADFLGANDSASGVAVLLTVAQQLQRFKTEWPYDFGIDFVFFDGEEGAPDTTSAWRPIGSEYFAQQTNILYGKQLPEAGVVVDMVCEKGARFKKDQSSRLASNVADKLWSAGANIDSRMFESGESDLNIHDDHTALSAAGIPSVVLIDYDYPQFHTSQDTLERCSSYTLNVVTNALLQFLRTY